MPDLTIGSDSHNDRRTPVRRFYPASEESLHRAALEALKARHGDTTLNRPVSWKQ